MRLPRPVSKARILIVEDDAALAEVLDYNLSQAGHPTQVVRDGQQALREIRLLPPARGVPPATGRSGDAERPCVDADGPLG